MPTELTLVSAFLVGLLGSTHCLGMCGGIVGALTLGLRDDIRRSAARLIPYLVAYNAGRIASYVVAGALAGLLSAQILHIAPPEQVRLATRIVTAGFMIALGLYLAGWWPGLAALERLGGKLWVRIEPVGRRFLPVNHPLKALALGLVWGWLPCGLVYSALAWSLASGDATRGATLMLAFGLGTLPMLLAMGAAARWLNNIVRRHGVRQGAGVLILLFGLYTLFMPTVHRGHDGSHSGESRSSEMSHLFQQHDTRPLMGTVVEMTVEGTDAARLTQAMDDAYREMARLSDMMNHYNPDSAVSAINNVAGKGAIAAPTELREVLAMARAVSQRTDGAFDITVGSLKGWRFNPADPRMPAAADIARQQPLIDFRDVLVNDEKATVQLRRAGQRIDLGGIAKLYILRAGMNVLAARGIGRALINGGGDVVARGTAQDKPWRVGIRDPRKPEALLGWLEVTQGYVVSSGDYERYFIKDGKRYHHILDPRTGYPAEGPRHVTLVSENIEQVNGVATAIMVLGAAPGRLLIERTKDLEGLIVDRDGGVWMSPGLEKRLHFPEPPAGRRAPTAE